MLFPLQKVGFRTSVRGAQQESNFFKSYIPVKFDAERCITQGMRYSACERV
jgi:hypothetical protein